MFDMNRNIWIIFFQAGFHSAGYTACHCISSACSRSVMERRIPLKAFDINIFCLGSKLLRNAVDQVRELVSCQSSPGGTAGGEQERQFSGMNFFSIVMRLGNCADICAQSDFIDLRKAQSKQSCLEFFWSNAGTKLSHKGRSNFCDNFCSFFQCVRQLENLRFIRNSAERTVYHAHTAGNTFLIVDHSTSLTVTFNGVDAAGFRAGAFLVGNSVVGTDSFTLSAADTFFLIDHRASVDDGNGALGANLRAGVSNAAPAHITDFVFIRFTGIAGRGDHLHQRGLIIFFIDIAGFNSRGNMNCLIFRAKGHSHSQTHSFAGDCPFPVNTFTVSCFFLNDGVRNCFDIGNQRLIGGIKSHFRNFRKNFFSDFFDRGI